MNYIQHFDIETSSNEKRIIRGIELENKIKMIFISDPDANTSSCSVAIGAGYLQDDYQGTAHFLEHLLFMGSEKYPEQNDYHSYIQINGGYDNAFTTDNMTCYYLSLDTTFLKKGIEMLSWFFRSPLLDEKHIKSEIEIIDSEHNKNVLIDNWIMDDIFKKFIVDDSKYKKFGTGNMSSLKNITKNDIINFYNKYYTTDNIYVCIVDTKNIDIMMNEYSIFFQEIEIKTFDENINRFEKNKLETIDNNIIFFKSSSDYIFVNYYLIFDAVEKNIIQYQLIFFINYLIGCEYDGSFAYNLKENNIIKHLSCLLEYFYDYQAVSNLQFILVDKNYNNFTQIHYSLDKLIYTIKNLSEEDFIEIYNNYKKIKMLKLLYNESNDSVYISNNVVENMIKGKLSEAIVRDNYVPEYSKNVYNNFLQIIDSIKIKITTNFDFINIDANKYIKSIWYNTSYYIDNFSFSKINDIIEFYNQKKRNLHLIKTNTNTNKKKYNIVNNNEHVKLLDWKINLLDTIGIKNFIIKNFIFKDTNKYALPELIENNVLLKRKIYIQEINKFNKPMSNITIIRKNKQLLNKKNELVMNIYIGICDKILNYFLEIMSNYKLSFSMILHNEYFIYNFNGLDYKLEYYINQIISKIHPEIIFNNEKINRYFDEIIRDMIETINNIKYNSPYIICSKFCSILLNNSLFPDKKIDFIKNLKFDTFKDIVFNCLKYSEEYYILTGIKKYGINFNFNNNVEYIFSEDSYMTYLIDTISLNQQKFLINDDDCDYVEKKIILSNHKIDVKFINPKELNNCVIKYWCLTSIDFNSNFDNTHINNGKNIIQMNVVKKIIKQKIITSFIAEIFNEPLFDKIRTIDKLGYIVKSDHKFILNNNQIYFIVLFLIQSTYSINKILSSIDEFNKYFAKDLKTNHENYFEKFRLMKESKLIEFLKPVSNLAEETNIYIESITSKIDDFDLNKLFYDECNNIDYDEDIKPILKNMKKLNNFNVILEKQHQN